MKSLPTDTRWIIIGAGFAGAATAWALGRAGLGPGLIVEQEESWGAHASGRNAAMARLSERDSFVGTLVRRSVDRIRELERSGASLLTSIGGLTLASASGAADVEAQRDASRAHGIDVELMDSRAARRRFPFLSGLHFDTALWCNAEGIVDIHALLGTYLATAREAGFVLRTNCRVNALIVEEGRVKGVRTSGGDVRGDAVVDASGAWAGRLGHEASALPLRALRRHLFVSAPTDLVGAGGPIVWLEDAGLYFRPDSGGLLLSPCDETEMPPCLPSTDPAAAELLAEKIAAHAPGLNDLTINRAWACLRTFTPDRRPLMGPDAALPGLFHVSGLGGFGMMCSAAVGELAADLLTGKRPDWIDPAPVSPARF